MKGVWKRNIVCSVSFLLLLTQNAFAAENPTGVVQDYYKALETAKTPKDLFSFYTKRHLADKEKELKGVPADRLSKFAQFNRLGLPKTIKTTSEKIEGEKAKVAVSASNSAPLEPSSSKEFVIQKFGVYFLARENGKWKIDAAEWSSDSDNSGNTNPYDWADWVKQAATIPPTDAPVKGKLEGDPFAPAQSRVGSGPLGNGTWLNFSQGRERQMWIKLLEAPGDVADKSFEIVDQKLSWPMKSMFNILLESPKHPGGSKTRAGAGVCVMKLKFGKKSGNELPGQIQLRMFDQPEISLAGSFKASISK